MIFEISGVKIHYEIEGSNEAADPVLCLHGWGCTAQHFRPIVNELKNEKRMITLDFPAHGASSEPPCPWDVNDFAKAVLALLDHLEVKTCDIIAHSFGGRVAIYLAAEHPQRVGRMILTGCAGIKKEASGTQSKRTLAYKRKKKLAQKLSALPFMKEPMARLQESLIQKYGSKDYAALTPSMRETFVRIISQDLRPKLKDIKASTLLVFGGKDTETPVWMGKVMEEEIPDAGLVIFEGEDHFAYLRQWPRFVKIIRTFLN